jgi:cold shock CspA family protein
MPERVVGTLVSWNAARGFGFVHRDHGEDVYVSAKDLAFCGIDDLQIGMRLSFVPRADQKSGHAPYATYIRVQATA